MITVSMPMDEFEAMMAKSKFNGQQEMMNRILPFISVRDEQQIGFMLGTEEERKERLKSGEVSWKIPMEDPDNFRFAIGKAMGFFQEPTENAVEEAKARGAFPYETSGDLAARGLRGDERLKVDIP